LAVRVGG
jgi:hypothetical protein